MDAVLVIDMLNDFLRPGAPLEVPNGRRIIPNIKMILEEARRRKIPVVYVCDSHLPEDGEFKIWPMHALEGSEGAKIYSEISPQGRDYIVKKRRYSGFFQTDLDLLLKELKIDRLFITGLLTNVCVLFTAVDAYMRGYDTIILSDATASLTDKDQEYFINYIRNILKLKAVTTEEAVKIIQGKELASQEGL